MTPPTTPPTAAPPTSPVTPAPMAVPTPAPTTVSRSRSLMPAHAVSDAARREQIRSLFALFIVGLRQGRDRHIAAAGPFAWRWAHYAVGRARAGSERPPIVLSAVRRRSAGAVDVDPY